jgi:hypothetical protein
MICLAATDGTGILMHGKETGPEAPVRLRRSKYHAMTRLGVVIRRGCPRARSRSSTARQFRIHVELECARCGPWVVETCSDAANAIPWAIGVSVVVTPPTLELSEEAVYDMAQSLQQ